MGIDWQNPDTKDRILAAIIASFDGTINCKEVARLYGGEATYNAIENFLRKPKKRAQQLKAEASGREGPAPSPARPRGTPSKPRTPKKDSVKSGRVSKGNASKSAPFKSKQEASDSTDDTYGEDDTNVTAETIKTLYENSNNDYEI